MGSVIGEVTPLALGVALSPFPVVPAVLLLSTARTPPAPVTATDVPLTGSLAE
ncbi:hypothetical protein ABT270_29690 [Streptomyces sp900105245]|uniref:hypothetical protein n=1 Tax=unclassified Streptomyces TaxID=2593676 RepID=UPI0033187D0B